MERLTLFSKLKVVLDISDLRRAAVTQNWQHFQGNFCSSDLIFLKFEAMFDESGKSIQAKEKSDHLGKHLTKAPAKPGVKIWLGKSTIIIPDDDYDDFWKQITRSEQESPVWRRKPCLRKERGPRELEDEIVTKWWSIKKLCLIMKEVLSANLNLFCNLLWIWWICVGPGLTLISRVDLQKCMREVYDQIRQILTVSKLTKIGSKLEINLWRVNVQFQTWDAVSRMSLKKSDEGGGILIKVFHYLLPMPLLFIITFQHCLLTTWDACH